MAGGRTYKAYLNITIGLSGLYFTYLLYTTWEFPWTRYASDSTQLTSGVAKLTKDEQKYSTTPSVIDSTTEQVYSKEEISSSAKKNVLFIIADDLRPQFEPYTSLESSVIRSPPMLTPNLKSLSSRSLVLTNAFVQFTLCGPSRASLLTGRRPDITRVYHNKQYWREVGGNFTTLPQLFKERGYTALCFGKVFHIPKTYGQDYPYSWSQPCAKVEPSTTPYYTKGAKPGGIWVAASERDLARNPLDDAVMVQQVMRTLKDYTSHPDGKPFFLAVGFAKPHLPFVCPQKFIERYDLEEDGHYLTKLEWQTPTVRKGCNVANTTKSKDQYSQLDERTLRYYRRAYFGCVSYIDSLVGQLLDTLDQLGLRESTVVSVTADHGYHLGENGLFGKQTTHDIGSRVPMMISLPGLTDGGVISDSLAESVDLLPTLAEAAGLGPVAPCPTNDSSGVRLCAQGANLLPLIDRPEDVIKTVVQTQVRPFLTMMQYSLRTERYRYAQWGMVNDTSGRYELVDLNNPRFQDELYDHRTDREEIENLVADHNYADVRRDMRQHIKQLWLEQNG